MWTSKWIAKWELCAGLFYGITLLCTLDDNDDDDNNRGGGGGGEYIGAS